MAEEFTARDTFNKAKVMLADSAQQKQGVVYLKAIVTNYKTTEAAVKAQAILDADAEHAKEAAK